MKQLTIKQQKELMKDFNILKNVKNLQQYKIKNANHLDNRYESLNFV